MNFGWLTPDSAADEINQVVLHEFGHALGCIHEHQNPAGGIKWNKKVVYEYYAGPPNFWLLSEAFCRRQHALVTGARLPRRAPWEEMSRSNLRQFWAQMVQRSRR